MAVRFRKSIKLAPGIRMNLSGGGLGWSLGPRGASVGIGKRGTFLNTGIPGTGLYSRQSLTGGSSSTGPQTSATTSVSMTVSVEDDGTITFKDSNGNPVSDALIEAAKKQKSDVIKATIQKTCDDINTQVEAIAELHLHTSPPSPPPTYQPQTFDVPRPIKPVPKAPGFFAKLFKSKVAKIEAENIQAQTSFGAEHRKWEATKAQFETAERKKQELVSSAVAGDPDAMESFFGEVLMDIVWPRETIVSFEVRDGGQRLAFDVDLPEIEDMPTKTASVPQRGFKLSVKEMGPTNIQKLYAKHIHSIGFRLLGEAFGMLPTVQEVTLSGYSQRKSKITGQEEDEYLFSVVVPRGSWEAINFSSLQSIDVLEAFTLFELRRDMTKTGLFKAIQAF
jgi:hypothetical protein